MRGTQPINVKYSKFTFFSVLKKCFDGFCQDGLIPVDTIGTILTMMDLRVKPSALREIIDEVDEDRSGFLEFEEFCQLSAKFLVEVDEEGV